MNIAYIILAHKLPEQLVRLVCKLNTDTTSFFIHVDKKTDDETYKRITEPLNIYKNVYFLKRRACDWGAFNMVEVALDGIRKILTLNIQCDYIISLTGQDYPIKSNKQIQKVLYESGKQNFVEYFPLPNKRWKDGNGGLDRINYWYFNFRGRSIAFIKKDQFESKALNFLWSCLAAILPIRRKLPQNIEMFGGSAYWCLTKDCIEYINKFVQRDRKLVNFFKFTLIPDESFFQTILLNSQFKSRIVNDNLRYIVWFASSHPEILCKQDFERFISTDKLFARKFDVTVDEDVLDMIDRATY